MFSVQATSNMAFKGQIFRSLYQVTLRMYVIVGKNFCNLIGMVFLKVMYFQHFSHKMIKEIRNIIGLDIGKKSKSKANFLSCSGVFKILSVAMSQLLKISYTITKLLFETSATSSLILSPAATEMSSFKILADLAPSWFILFSHHHHILIFRCKLFLIPFLFGICPIVHKRHSKCFCLFWFVYLPNHHGFVFLFAIWRNHHLQMFLWITFAVTFEISKSYWSLS